MHTVSSSKCFGGTQGVYDHDSAACGVRMRFAVFTPPQAAAGDVPVVWFLSGLTCTHANFVEKAGAQRMAAELGLMLVVPDTSPRGEGVPGDPEGAWDFGLGAGFYLDATQAPWSRHYRMRTYVEDELPALVGDAFPADLRRQGITGHSMGGHGALTIALRNPRRFCSVSAFAPIAAPMQSPWGQKALRGYLGDDRTLWRTHDACALLDDGARLDTLLVDQGTDDPHLATQLHPELLEAACTRAGVDLTLRRQPGYDHGYFFVATFVADHLAWHARRLH